jgi:hypothetical protein
MQNLQRATLETDIFNIFSKSFPINFSLRLNLGRKWNILNKKKYFIHIFEFPCNYR